MKKIKLLTKADLVRQLYENLKQLRLPDYLLYMDHWGAENWLALDKSKKFSVTSQLTKLTQENIGSIAQFLPRDINIVSIGVGSGEKDHILLKELVPKKNIKYYPIDINEYFVDMTLQGIEKLPIEKTGIVGSIEDISTIKTYLDSPYMLCMLGNTFCNYEPDRILKILNENLDITDFFLLDCQLFPQATDSSVAKKDLEEMYRCEENVTFNKYPLIKYGMNPDNIQFHMELLSTNLSTGTVYKTHKNLKITTDGSVKIGTNTVHFKSGDVIKMGFTYKYTYEQIISLLKKWRFTLVKSYMSDDCANILIFSKKQKVSEG